MRSRAGLRWTARVLPVLLVGSSLLGLGCGGREPATETALPAIPDPDLSSVEPRVVEALQLARAEVEARPEDGEAWGNLGTMYDAHGLLDLAETCYRAARELSPDDFRWAYLLAVVREIAGAEADEVVALFGEAAGLDPDYWQVHLRLGDALSRRGRHEQALTEFEQALERAPGSAVANRGLGQALLQLGQAEAAVESLTRAVKLEPRDRLAAQALAQASMRLGLEEQGERAMAASEGLEPLSSIDDPVWNELVFQRSLSPTRVFKRALARIRDGDFEGAVVDLESVVASRPDEASVHYWKGLAHKRLNQMEPAVRHLTRAVELNGRMVVARSRLAEVFFAQGRYDEAAAQYAAAAEVNPQNPAVFLAWAEVLLRQKDLDGIVEAYETAARLTSLGPHEQLNLGVALMRSGRPEDAVEHLEDAVRQRPDHRNAHYNLGVAYRMLGRDREAAEQFEIAKNLEQAPRLTIQESPTGGN